MLGLWLMAGLIGCPGDELDTGDVWEPAPNTDPNVTLTVPTGAFEGSVEINGSASDADQPASTLLVTVEAAVDGSPNTVLFSGNPDVDGTWQTDVGLSPGDYTITAKVVDGAGGEDSSASKALTINAVNQVPVCSILSPADNEVFGGGDFITFSATATDFEDGSNLTIFWDSDIEGSIAFGQEWTRTLSDGVHIITLSVKDTTEQECVDTVTIYAGVTPGDDDDDDDDDDDTGG